MELSKCGFHNLRLHSKGAGLEETYGSTEGPSLTRSILVQTAIEPLLAMNGKSRALLVKDRWGQPWVLKLRYNDQHDRVAVNEFLGTCLAKKIGLTVPESRLMRLNKSRSWHEVLPQQHILNNLDAWHFASSYVGGRWPGRSYETIPSSQPYRVINGAEFAGVLALDLWLRNTDTRQALFVRAKRSNLLCAYWIDFGNCFGASDWCLSGGMKALFEDRSVYAWIRSMDDFAPWLDRIQRISLEGLLQPSQSDPCNWLTGNDCSLELLVMELNESRKYLYARILSFVEANPSIFISWKRGQP